MINIDLLIAEIDKKIAALESLKVFTNRKFEAKSKLQSIDDLTNFYELENKSATPPDPPKIPEDPKIFIDNILPFMKEDLEGMEYEKEVEEDPESDVDVDVSEEDVEDSEEDTDTDDAEENETEQKPEVKELEIKTEPEDPDFKVFSIPEFNLLISKLEAPREEPPEPPQDPNKRRRIKNSRYNPEEYDLKPSYRTKKIQTREEIIRAIQKMPEPPAVRCDRWAKEKRLASLKKLRERQLMRHPVKQVFKAHYFHCRVCNKTFSQAYSLTRHSYLHSGHRPYKCHICNYKFIQRSDLDRHVTTHDPFGKLPCQHCGMRFKTKKSLKNHEILHIDPKPYVCHLKFCALRFRSNKSLRSHFLQYHCDDRYMCDLCPNVIYRLKDYLKSHMKTHMIGGTNYRPRNKEEILIHAVEREKRIKKVVLRTQRLKIRRMFGYKF